MNKEKYWNNQVILITGSSRGIGKELAIHLSSLGAKIAINYLSNKKLAKEVMNNCSKESAQIYQADVSKEEDVKKMIEQIEKDFGTITVLINNAGQTKDSLLMMMSTEDWQSLQRVHLDGAFFCSKKTLMGMISLKHGRIINISSVSGITGTAGQCNYSTVKAGLIGLTKALSKEVGRFNITCNAIALGAIETDMTANLPASTIKKFKKATSLNRIGKTSEISGLVEYIAGPQGSYLTGQVISLDGGMT